jgi:hypothetical protein
VTAGDRMDALARRDRAEPARRAEQGEQGQRGDEAAGSHQSLFDFSFTSVITR